MLLRHAIGQRLRHARTAAGMSIRALSRQAGISVGYLSEVERGRKEVSSELLAAICRALDVTVPDLVSAAAYEMQAGSAASVVLVPMPTVAAAHESLPAAS